MKYIYIKPIILYAFLIIMSCEPVPEFKFDESIPVVEAFLYQGSSVDDIKVTEVIPFGSSKNDNEVNGLDISISWKGSSFPLINEEKGGGRYYYPGEDLDIISGETYEINFIYDGEEVSSSTTIPYAPTSLNLSSNSSELPQLLDFWDIRDLRQNENVRINVEWDNPNGDYYYLVIENIESNPEPIDVNNILNFNFEFVSTPIQDNFFNMIPFIHYTQFGTHRIILYRVNEEYALLYETVEQDSRDLNEPYSNIINGEGIFSGFASDTVYLEINKK